MDILIRAIHRPTDGSLVLEGRRGFYEDEAPDVFFLREPEIAKLPRSWRKLVGAPDRGHARVRWPEPPKGGRRARLQAFAPEFARLGVEPLEADVSPIKRWIIDHPKAILPAPEEWRVLLYDFETERIADFVRPWQSRILSFSWRTLGGPESARGHVRLREKTDAAELDLLAEFSKIVERHDVVVGWNSARFDQKLVQGRSEILGHDLPEVHWLDQLVVFKRNFLRTEDGGVKQSFALDNIAGALLGEERKVPLEQRARELGYSSGDLFSWTWKHAPALLAEYNDQDVRLMEAIEGRTKFLSLHFAVCRICRVFPDEWSVFPSVQIDGRMLTLGEERGFRFPTKHGADGTEERARGAFVPEAVVGLHESVAVLDYARMYPSIIRAWNMSLETLVGLGEKECAVVPETDERGVLTGNRIACFRTDVEGIVPMALRAIIEERKRWSKLKDAAEVGSREWHDAGRLSTACKALANSFYGVLLSPVSRFYRAEIGSSVTSIGRHLLASTIGEVRRRGHSLVFGDTDSVAFVADDEQAVAVRDAVNGVVVPEILSSCGAKSGEVRIEYEKRFREVLVTASKKYAGRFAVYDGKPVADPKVEVRGLEIVRSDQCKAARVLQRATVERILDRAPADELWDSMVKLRDEFLRGSSPVADLVLRKSISRMPEEYATKPPQARVAEKIAADGGEVFAGLKIAYVYAPGGEPVVAESKDGSTVDLVLYWNKYVYPPTARCLASAFPERNWDAIEAPRGWHPGQLDIFTPAQQPSPAQPAPAQIDLGSRVRRTRKGTRPWVPDVVIELDEFASEDRVRRVGEAISAYPGDLGAGIEIRVESQGSLVEMRLPTKIDDPARNAGLANVLRALGVTWRRANMGLDGTKKTQQRGSEPVDSRERGADLATSSGGAEPRTPRRGRRVRR